MLLRSEWKSLVSVVKCVCQEYGLVELPSESKNESLKATIWLQRLSTTWVIWELLRVDWLMCRNTAGRFGFCLVLRTPLPGFCFLHQTESMPKQLRFFRMEAEDPRFGNARYFPRTFARLQWRLQGIQVALFWAHTAQPFRWQISHKCIECPRFVWGSCGKKFRVLFFPLTLNEGSMSFKQNWWWTPIDIDGGLRKGLRTGRNTWQAGIWNRVGLREGD